MLHQSRVSNKHFDTNADTHKHSSIFHQRHPWYEIDFRVLTCYCTTNLEVYVEYYPAIEEPLILMGQLLKTALGTLVLRILLITFANLGTKSAT